MLNNYDKIAPYYDTLSRLVFFKSQIKAQVNQLKHIPKNSSILIVGGGTGWILEEISKHCPEGLKIVYVEISARMTVLSKARNAGNNDVEFVNIGIEEFKFDKLFDIILTPFLFDNFNTLRANIVFKKLDELLNKNGLWFLVDFNLSDKKGKWWKRIFLNSMYLFFRLLKIVEADKLIEITPYFLDAAYQIKEDKFYYMSFIRATIFEKK